MNLAVEGAFQFLPESWLESYTQSSSALEGNDSVWMILATVVMAPLAEEIVFRAAAMSRLRRGFSWFAAALIQATVFGLCHGQLIWFVYTALLGFIMGWVWETLKSTWATILIHFAFNGFSMLLMMDSVYEVMEKIPALGMLIGGLVMTAVCLAAIVMQGGTENLKKPYAWVDPDPYVHPRTAPSQNLSPYAAPNGSPYGQNGSFVGTSPYAQNYVMPGYPQQPYAGQYPPAAPQQPYAGEYPPVVPQQPYAEPYVQATPPQPEAPVRNEPAQEDEPRVE